MDPSTFHPNHGNFPQPLPTRPRQLPGVEPVRPAPDAQPPPAALPPLPADALRFTCPACFQYLETDPAAPPAQPAPCPLCGAAILPPLTAPQFQAILSQPSPKLTVKPSRHNMAMHYKKRRPL